MINSILIIGASSDIGIELIKNIDKDCLIIAHYNSSYGELKRLKSQNNNIIPIKANLMIESELNNLIEKVVKKIGVPEKIVHLAATPVKQIRFNDVNWNNFEADILISLKSLVLILRKFLPLMAAEKKGKVVIMLSSYVLGVPPIALSHYTTTKYALLGFMKSIASEYKEKNIQINAISPSLIETKFLENIHERSVELSAYNHPLKRNAKVSDIVPVIELLLSEDSNYMNGTNIPITGGSVF
jgi:3-oxoacyl-[acyl-carrier protein] reductase